MKEKGKNPNKVKLDAFMENINLQNFRENQQKIINGFYEEEKAKVLKLVESTERAKLELQDNLQE